MGAFHKLSLREMLTPSEAAGETKTNKWMVGDTKERRTIECGYGN
jgi:hypothetical protein